jgi:hypothetical protein
MFRMCWRHIVIGGIDEGCGPWMRNRRRLLRSIDFGNNHHGAGTHWLTERSRELWKHLRGAAE